MGLSREQIQKRLVERYGSEDPKLLKEISYNLTVAGTTEANLESRAELALKRLRAALPCQAGEAMHQATQTTAHNKLSTCPICKTGMRSVKIMDDRQVYFCTQHRVAQPYPIETIEPPIDPKGDA